MGYFESEFALKVSLAGSPVDSLSHYVMPVPRQ